MIRMGFQFDPAAIGLKVGLEIHQQLDTGTKLFCSCPVGKTEDFPYSFERRLRPAQSETGRVDPAAVFEFAKGKANVYRWSPESSCLVEADEERLVQVTAQLAGRQTDLEARKKEATEAREGLRKREAPLLALDAERTARTESMQLQMKAIRQIVRYLRPERGHILGGWR